MENEGLIRISIFLGLFAVLAILERIIPKRTFATSTSQRWMTNWGFSVINTLSLRLLGVVLPFLAVGATLDAQAKGWGLLNLWNGPAWIEIIIAILILDFAIWAQHLITHKIPILWRLHQVHHADVEMDVTTAIRFHPFEIALSMLLKIGLVYLLGPSALAVILFEILLNGTAMFNHSNLALPKRLDRLLRMIIVTPDMHRIHHSINRHEHDSNYGFSLSLWDRLFGTYIEQTQSGDGAVVTGLRWQDTRPTQLGWSLLLPFRRK